MISKHCEQIDLSSKLLRILFFWILSSQTSFGDSVENALQDAQARQNQAAQKFYRGLRDLGPQATAEQETALRVKVMLPAEVASANALSQVFSQRVSEIRQSIFEIMKNNLGDAKAPKWLLSPNDRLKDLSGPPPDGDKTQDATEKPRSEKGLDGSHVPKEIEFGAENSTE